MTELADIPDTPTDGQYHGIAAHSIGHGIDKTDGSIKVCIEFYCQTHHVNHGFIVDPGTADDIAESLRIAVTGAILAQRGVDN